MPLFLIFHSCFKSFSPRILDNRTLSVTSKVTFCIRTEQPLTSQLRPPLYSKTFTLLLLSSSRTHPMIHRKSTLWTSLIFHIPLFILRFFISVTVYPSTDTKRTTFATSLSSTNAYGTKVLIPLPTSPNICILWTF